MALTVNGANLQDLSLDFTLPGYNVELKPGGAMIDVDDSNLEEYLELVLDKTLGSGVMPQVKAFQQGKCPSLQCILEEVGWLGA